MNCPACNEEEPGEGAFCSSCGESLGGSDCLPPGTLLMQGAYQIETVLGQGGFGITYRAQDNNLHRAVAIKEFFPTGCRRATQRVSAGGTWSKSTYQEARQRFLEEGRTLARFNHPGIVRVFAAFEENESAYIVMELLNGLSLAGLLEQRGRLPEAEALELVRRVGEALEEVHRLDMLHRDIKPPNILLCEDGRIVLVDFGTARQFASGVTSKHSVMLTPGYAPLEQYAERGRRGPYTDVYSLAATLYHLLSGSFPESATERAAGLPLTELAELCPDVSPPVAAAVARGLHMDVAQRPQSVAEFLLLLKPIAAETVAKPKEVVPPRTPPPVEAIIIPVKVVPPGKTVAEAVSNSKSQFVAPAASSWRGKSTCLGCLAGVFTLFVLVPVGLVAWARHFAPPPPPVGAVRQTEAPIPSSPTPLTVLPVTPSPAPTTDDPPTTSPSPPPPIRSHPNPLPKINPIDKMFLALYQSQGMTSQFLPGFELGVSTKEDVTRGLKSFPRNRTKILREDKLWTVTYGDDLSIMYEFREDTLAKIVVTLDPPKEQESDLQDNPFYKALKSRFGKPPPAQVDNTCEWEIGEVKVICVSMYEFLQVTVTR